jgi:NAD-dependent dihydropyrimidine dehydrogenase PreA subunit
MDPHRIVLHFPEDIIQQPIICQLAKEHDVEFSVLRAEIEEDSGGMMVLGLRGADEAVHEAVEYLRARGVRIEPLQQDIRIDPDQCIHCGACVGQCPTGALYVEEGTRRVALDSEKCIACQHCVPACPYRAISVHFV